MARHDALDELADARRFGPRELAVLEVDVVDDLRDRRESGVLRRDAVEQDLERAPVALVREVAARHVETQLSRAGGSGVGVHEAEPRRGVDEPADEPGRRDPVHLDAPPRHPGAPPQPDRGARRVRGRVIPMKGTFTRAKHGLDLLPPVSFEEIHGTNLGEALRGSSELGGAIGLLAPGSGAGAARLQAGEERLVLGGPLAPEAGDEVLRGHALDERRRADERVAAAGAGFLRDPREILPRFLRVRERVDRVLERDRPDLREALPDLRPQIERPRGELVDEKKPGRGWSGRHMRYIATAIYPCQL